MVQISSQCGENFITVWCKFHHSVVQLHRQSVHVFRLGLGFKLTLERLEIDKPALSSSHLRNRHLLSTWCINRHLLSTWCINRHLLSTWCINRHLLSTWCINRHLLSTWCINRHLLSTWCINRHLLRTWCINQHLLSTWCINRVRACVRAFVHKPRACVLACMLLHPTRLRVGARKEIAARGIDKLHISGRPEL